MEQPIIKTTRQVGTSSGVLLPKRWLGATVEVKIIREPANPLIDSIKILQGKSVVPDIQAIALTGSYARNEHDKESDIDILVITKDTTGNIARNNYSITIISEKDLKESINCNPIYHYPMLYESKPLLNEPFIEKYKKNPITGKNLRIIIEDIRKALNKNKEVISLDKGLGSKKTSDIVAYSLVLRLRSIEFLDKIQKNEQYSKKQFQNKIDNVINRIYLSVKKGNKIKNSVPIDKAEKMIKQIEQWLEKKERLKSK